MRIFFRNKERQLVIRSVVFSFMILFGSLNHVFAVTWATEWTQILNNIQLLAMKANQAKQLYNDAAMIKNQVESLKSIASYKGSWQSVDQILSQIESIRQRSESSWNQVNSVYQRTLQMYPDIAKNQGYVDGLKVLNDPVIAVAEGSVETAADRIGRQQKEAQAVKELLQKSNDAVGQTQTLQVMNQLLAQLIEQTQAIREQNDWIRLQMSTEYGKRAKSEDQMSDNMNAVFQEYKSTPSDFKLDKEF